VLNRLDIGEHSICKTRGRWVKVHTDRLAGFRGHETTVGKGKKTMGSLGGQNRVGKKKRSEKGTSVCTRK